MKSKARLFSLREALILSQYHESIKQDLAQNRDLKTFSRNFLFVWYCSNTNRRHFQFLSCNSILCILRSCASPYIPSLHLQFPQRATSNIWLILLHSCLENELLPSSMDCLFETLIELFMVFSPVISVYVILSFKISFQVSSDILAGLTDLHLCEFLTHTPSLLCS